MTTVRAGWLLLVAGVVAAVSPIRSGEAQTRDNSPYILLHVASHTTTNNCSGITFNCCKNVVTAGNTNTFYDLFVLAAPSDSLADAGTGIAGMQFGIDYFGSYNPGGSQSGLCVFSWTLCATLHFPSPSPAWPGPDSGILITWDPVENCQRELIAVAGYFYMAAYEPSNMRITGHPVDHQTKLADCGSLEMAVLPPYEHNSEIARASFSAGSVVSGFNSCMSSCTGVTVRPATWSRIKSQVRQ